MKIQEFFKNNAVVADLAEAELRALIAKTATAYLLTQKLEAKFDFVVEHPTEESFGDYATNVAMALTKIAKKNPLEIANAIAEKISRPDLIEKVEVVSPGFINFYLKSEYYQKELQNILAKKEKYGSFEMEHPQKVMIEFGQPNTHKAFHIGHLRSAISGLSVARLFENLGYAVIKTNYYGDIGMQTAKSVWGILQKGIPADFENWDKHKRMKYINDAYAFASENFDANEAEIRKINKEIYNKEDTENVRLYEKIKLWSLEHLNAVFANLGIIYDKQYPESSVCENALKIVENNIGKIFQKSEGALIYNGDKDGLSSWVFRTGEGIPTYSAKDLALAFKKFEDFDLDLNITLTSVEQTDYFKAIIKILETLDDKFKDKYLHIPFGWLLRAGKKTSSRMGNSVKGMDIIQEANDVAKEKIKELKDYDAEKREKIAGVVALAGLKFLILSREFHKNINYDPQKFVSFEGFSGPYILYAFVRAQSILKKGGVEKGEGDGFAAAPVLSARQPKILKSEFEQNLLKWLTRYPQVAYRACAEISPHLVCNYLYELSQKFNQFYANCPVLTASADDKQSRLALASATAQVLKNGLSLLGIETIEEM
ncbi:MAG: arginine--tRNA ligase [Patescibacteria group bacterium]